METCPERDKLELGRTRPCDDRSDTPTSIHTEHGCVQVVVSGSKNENQDDQLPFYVALKCISICPRFVRITRDTDAYSHAILAHDILNSSCMHPWGHLHRVQRCALVCANVTVMMAPKQKMCRGTGKDAFSSGLAHCRHDCRAFEFRRRREK